jgi:acyl-CoA thioester hydrolase
MTPFRYYTRVRYQDCDAQHVVFNARYGDYVDLAVTEFLRSSFPDRDPFDGSFEIQVVRQLIEWKAPARYNDVLEITAQVSRFGTTSVTIAFEMRLAGREGPAADPIVTAEVVYVAVDGTTWKKRPFTPNERAKLEAGGAGKIVDHAGHYPIRT